MTSPSLITHRVEALRNWMREHDLIAYIFPSTDPHSGEYVPDHWKTREWISGFNGSAGTAVVTLNGAALWTDSRYWLAAEEQTKDTPFEVIRCSRNVATAEELVEWIIEDEKLKVNSEKWEIEGEQYMVGLDGWSNTAQSVEELRMQLAINFGLTLETELDAAGELWEDRPPVPDAPIEIQPLELAGRTVADKLADIRQALKKNGANALIVSQLDEIAWTLNLRGQDVHCTPVFVSYLIILPETTEAPEAILYINDEKLTDEVRAYLKEKRIQVRPYEAIEEDLMT